MKNRTILIIKRLQKQAFKENHVAKGGQLYTANAKGGQFYTAKPPKVDSSTQLNRQRWTLLHS